MNPRKPVTADASLRALISELGSPAWRWRWWTELERTQPFVAARLIQKFPDRYPVPPPEA